MAKNKNLWTMCLLVSWVFVFWSSQVLFISLSVYEGYRALVLLNKPFCNLKKVFQQIFLHGNNNCTVGNALSFLIYSADITDGICIAVFIIISPHGRIRPADDSASLVLILLWQRSPNVQMFDRLRQVKCPVTYREWRVLCHQAIFGEPSSNRRW